MPILLPLDVIDSILSYLCGTASIAECALVCRTWLPSARYHLFPPHKAIDLDQLRIARFLRLLDLPGSTLSLVTFNKLDLRQNTLPNDWNSPPEEFDWRSEVAIRDLLARDLILFRSVTSLSLRWVNWRTLSPPAITSLHRNFTSVTELTLQGIPLTSSDFCMLLAALTGLEKITIDPGVPFDSDPWTSGTVQVSPPNLRHLVFSRFHDSWMVQFFNQAIRYPSGITCVSIEMYRNKDELQSCAELLETAGENLRSFNFSAAKVESPSPGTDNSYSALLAFPHNRNLQEIDIGSVDESTITLLLQGLKTNPQPNLCRLRLGLGLYESLEKWTGGPLMDEILSAIVVKDSKLIVDLPDLHNSFDYATNTLEVLRTLEKIHLEKFFEWWMNMLPRTVECWTLEVHHQSSYICSRPHEGVQRVHVD